MKKAVLISIASMIVVGGCSTGSKGPSQAEIDRQNRQKQIEYQRQIDRAEKGQQELERTTRERN